MVKKSNQISLNGTSKIHLNNYHGKKDPIFYVRFVSIGFSGKISRHSYDEIPIDKWIVQ